MWYIIFQITFLISFSSFTSIGARDTVSACVPDTYNNNPSGICRDVFYYLSQTDHANCNRVCRVHGMSCTAVNHGFNDTIVLKIFEALLGHTCLKKNHAYTATGPAVHNLTRGTTYCTRWKNIPEKMNCNRSPVYKRRFRLCPCVENFSATSNSTNQYVMITAIDQAPRASTTEFPRPTATDQLPRATATNQSPGPTAMYNDTTTGPGHSAAYRQSKKDFLLIVSFIFLAFFQFY